MFAFGGLLMSRNFTVRMGDTQFSTDDNEHAMVALQRHYKLRTDNPKKKAAECQQRYTAEEATEAEKQKIIEDVISHYLVPTSHDSLFGRDVVFVHGKGKPIIMPRADFDDDVGDLWKWLLADAGVKDCVDTYRIGTEFSAVHQPAVTEAVQACRERKASLSMPAFKVK